MAALIRKWKRVMAVGCSHGDIADKSILQQVIDFRKRYRPEIRFELGDVVDTAAFRAGARGTKDESRPVAPDFLAGREWLMRYEPTHITWGNHDARLQGMIDSPNAVMAHAAGVLWGDLQQTAAKLRAKTVDYDYENNWFYLGGTYWGHGFWFNESAVRDHAEYLGGPVVMAHLHVPQCVQGRTRAWTESFCVGTLGDIARFDYARRRRATSRWAHGVVWGEVCETEAKLWLASCPPGGMLHFPI